MGKQHISKLAAIMAAKGIQDVVVSPGSRNAPAIILFGTNRNLRLISVADERSAGFFALGIAMCTGKPAALLCTSGSAVLNYSPAIAEAYYQKIPLLIITADRPVEMVDQGDSQTIRQNNVYSNFIRKSFILPERVLNPNDEWYFERLVNEAIDRTQFPAPGPVHINLPLDEPLYDLDIESTDTKVRIIDYKIGVNTPQPALLDELCTFWKKAKAKLIIVGQQFDQLNDLLLELASDPNVVILTECTSNVSDNGFVECIDRTLSQIPTSLNDKFKPDILLSLGGAIVSKKVKAMLRDMNPSEHWHISSDPDEFYFDTYKSLTLTLAFSPIEFLSSFTKNLRNYTTKANETISYSQIWKEANLVSLERHKKFLQNLPFSDLQVYSEIFGNIPSDSNVHLGNSTPVRYAQLFNHPKHIRFYSNRGTSGIDGCSSTAAGFAYKDNRLTVVITGDVGFLYDSNSLWNQNLSSNFRIIIINNGGGNIFRIIEGPGSYKELEPYIETKHSWHASGITANFGIPYYKVHDLDELTDQLPLFFAPQHEDKPAVLEVFTDNVLSAQVLKDYFKFLREG